MVADDIQGGAVRFDPPFPRGSTGPISAAQVRIMCQRAETFRNALAVRRALSLVEL